MSSCPKVISVYGWLRYVIPCLWSFLIVYNNDIWALARYDCISFKHFKTLCRVANYSRGTENIKCVTGSIVFRVGWKNISNHYASVIETLPSKNKGYQSVCLTTWLLEDETIHNAEKLVRSLQFVLSVSVKGVKKMMKLLGDNSNVNRCLST